MLRSPPSLPSLLECDKRGNHIYGHNLPSSGLFRSIGKTSAEKGGSYMCISPSLLSLREGDKGVNMGIKSSSCPYQRSEKKVGKRGQLYSYLPLSFIPTRKR